MGKQINLFVPGRLCIFGEHSDWAGMYRIFNSGITKGTAIVTGIEQGIYASAEKAEKFIMCCSSEMPENEYWECEMDTFELLAEAHKGGYFSYVAGVASYIKDKYNVGGVKITITRRNLPLRSGLSSSAAICVLVARAFNLLYNLKMNTKGEMEAALRGEQRTPSRCGRLDQACAYGVKPVLMDFNGVEVDSKELRVGTTFYWVIANLMSSKDTIKILTDLSKAYPFASNDAELRIQEALGPDNQSIVSRAVKLLEEGKPCELGQLMNEAQKNFDEKIAPACTELAAPVLHSVLNDPNIKSYIYGAKGVGSQGDGTVQLLAKGEEAARTLQEYLVKERGMPSFTLTLKPGQSIKKAIIPLAGFGTRVFPATKTVRKCFLPLLDEDGVLKPALMILLENLIEAGIEEICLIIGEDEQAEFDRFFEPLPEEYREKLPEDKAKCEEQIERMRHKITFVHQKERKGFGHAVWLARQFTNDEPVLLLLGDFVYRSNSGISCCKQIMDAYKDCGRTLISIIDVPISKVPHYGILHGVWEDDDEDLMKVDSMVEKPTDDYAKEYLGVADKHGDIKYYATFGQYVLTPEVFLELEYQIKKKDEYTEGQEYGLTSALDAVRDKYGMYAFVPDGKSYDIGLPDAYRQTMWEFYK